MLFIWGLQNLKFLQYASDILKRCIISDAKNKFILRNSGIPSFKKAITRFIPLL